MQENFRDNVNVVLVTGASRRLGAAIAKHFHAHNYNIIIHYRSDNSKSEAEFLKKQLNISRPGSAACIQVDFEKLVDKKLSLEIFDNIMNCFGRLDVLVNNASTFFATSIGQTDLNAWRDLMISNAGGPFFLSQGLAKYLKKHHGAIINISDIHASLPLKGYSVYSMAKAANNMLTKALARELAPEIRVNGVAPGSILEPVDLKDQEPSVFLDKMIQKTVLKRLATSEDIAKTVLFLAENNSITGQIISVDAGRTIKL